jgi:hypothetical protein
MITIFIMDGQFIFLISSGNAPGLRRAAKKLTNYLLYVSSVKIRKLVNVLD